MTTRALDALRLVAKPPRCTRTPIMRRRATLQRALDEQIRLAECMGRGEVYASTQERWSLDPVTGDRQRTAWPRRVYAWFWQVDGSNWYVTLRYGNRCLDLTRGRKAVEVYSLGEVVATLRVLAQATAEGEFDTALETASRTIHARFGR